MKALQTLVFILLVATIAKPAAASEQNFSQWKMQFAGQARAQGVSPSILAAFMREARFLPRVIELDRKQPESKMTYQQYYANVVTQNRIDNGRAQLKANYSALDRAERRYGVPKQIIVALWGMETSFGKNMGDWGVLSTLATLAYEGRRAAFFKQELMAALQILQQENMPVSRLRGSWAGAMAQIQFMPSSFLRYAQDGNGDGHRDIWNNKDDVFASAANYLKQNGWNASLPWGGRVTLHHKIAPAFVGLDEDQGRTLALWHNQGVREDNDKPLRVPVSEKLWLVAPDGLDGPKYLVTRNYKAIMKWNKSTYFATSVGRLSDEVAQTSGRAPLSMSSVPRSYDYGFNQ